MSDSSVAPPRADHLPRHVAMIMDGNGRWAIDRGLTRLDGHKRGADVVRDITTFARELGISYVTLFSFSRQNWRRPAAEVAGVMQLLAEYCQRERDTLMENEIRLTTIGEMERLPSSCRATVEALVEETADNRKMTLTLAVNYGGREELVTAMKRLARDVKKKRLAVEQISEVDIAARLDTALLPDPDLLIRTSGEMRISNFLLWQLAYAELYFTEVRWPDFTRGDFSKALWAYARRERRFGATSQQLFRDIDDQDRFELGPLDRGAGGEERGPC